MNPGQSPPLGASMLASALPGPAAEAGDWKEGGEGAGGGGQGWQDKGRPSQGLPNACLHIIFLDAHASLGGGIWPQTTGILRFARRFLEAGPRPSCGRSRHHG